jgi:hypothetical protein
MQHVQLVTEEKLHQYADFAESRGIIPELIFRLIAASVQNPRELRLPVGGSTGQRGWDGVLLSPVAFGPYVPEGQSFWEIGTGADPKAKANDDLANRSEKTEPEQQALSTFVFVTPRSAYRAWSSDDQDKWIKEQKAKTNWRDIWVLDATKLVAWKYFFPGIDLWLADRLDIPTAGISTPALHWKVLQDYGKPPPLKPDVFLINRQPACEQLCRVFEGEMMELRLETRYPAEGADFVAAALAALDDQTQSAYAGRCLIIDDPNSWKAMCSLQTPHVFIGTPSLDLESSGEGLRAQARSSKHAVVFAATPSTGVRGNAVSLTEARPFELQEALIKSGYLSERARNLSVKCGGRIIVLKRLLLELSALPAWANATDAADLAMAAMIGRWDGDSPGDRVAVEAFLGKKYGEWIRTIRRIAVQPDPPLIERDGKWKFVSRFEAWQVLGKHISHEDLERFYHLVLTVLTEIDPKLDLPPDERWYGNIRGKKSLYSVGLREGVAETLALLGAMPTALSSVVTGRPSRLSDELVAKILSKLDWKTWASIQDVLPLFAEAAPDAFLSVLERELSSERFPITDLFQQETAGITGRTYVTGLLWGLEALAWNERYLTRVTLILARLAEKDRGGNWTNRPVNSLTTIFLPWFPQTAASVEKRSAALATLSREHPQLGWKVLVDLLPGSHSVSSGTHKPVWRGWVPSNQDEGVSQREHLTQVKKIVSLLVDAALKDRSKLPELVSHLDHLPDDSRRLMLEHLSSPDIRSLPDSDKTPIWRALLELVSKHRKFSDAHWALSTEAVNQIEAVTRTLTPESLLFKHQRLFSGRGYDLMEERGNWEEQRQRLEQVRQAAVREIFQQGGIEEITRFAQTVDEPWNVGHALAAVSTQDIDQRILPSFLVASPPLGEDGKKLLQFAAGFVWARYNELQISWAASLPNDQWNSLLTAEFLALLPFTKEVWDLAADLLDEMVLEYWKRTPARIYDPAAINLAEAAVRLLNAGRPDAAVGCIFRAIHENVSGITSELVVQALDQLGQSGVSAGRLNVHNIVDVIKWLQDHPPADRVALERIEWGFLGILDRHYGVFPKALESRLAKDPKFFSEVIQAVFRSEHAHESETISDERKRIAQNAYRLLTEWRTVPGRGASGAIDDAEILDWIKRAKEICKESGHLEVALSQIGGILAYAPPDPSGTWIHHTVAKILDEPDAERIRDGFVTENLNRRGVHSWTKGREERELAAKYHEHATIIEEQYPRLAAAVRKLADYYERDAQAEETRSPFDD